VFEVAYFWHLDPAGVMALSLTRFEQYENQAHRLDQLMGSDNG